MKDRISVCTFCNCKSQTGNISAHACRTTFVHQIETIRWNSHVRWQVLCSRSSAPAGTATLRLSFIILDSRRFPAALGAFLFRHNVGVVFDGRLALPGGHSGLCSSLLRLFFFGGCSLGSSTSSFGGFLRLLFFFLRCRLGFSLGFWLGSFLCAVGSLGPFRCWCVSAVLSAFLGLFRGFLLFGSLFLYIRSTL